MRNKAEMSWRSLAAAGLIAGGLFTATDKGPSRVRAEGNSASSYSLQIDSSDELIGNTCEVPDLVTANEQGLFSLNNEVIGGPVKVDGILLWNVSRNSKGEIISGQYTFDASPVVTDEVLGFEPIKVPEGMMAYTVVVNDDAKEERFVVMGGENAVICQSDSGDGYVVKQMLLMTQPTNYEADKANQWIHESDYNTGSDTWSPLPVIEDTPTPIEHTPTPTEAPSPTPTATAEPTSTATPEPTATPVEMELTPDQKELVEVTATHLVGIYGESMSPEHYPDEEAKLNFFRELTMMGIRLSPDNPNFANQLAAVMRFETAGSFAPDQPNLQGSDAVGLIQFMGVTAENMGLSTEQLAAMSPTEQLIYVEKFLSDRQIETGVTIRTLTDAYLAVFWPSGMGQGGDFILFEQGTDAYTSNGGVLDLNGDGKVTGDEATDAVLDSALSVGEKWQFLVTDGTEETMPSLDRQLEIVNTDYATMQAFADANTELYGSASYQYLCLMGVRISISQVLPEMDKPLLVGSAYLVNDVFASRPDLFTQLQITSEEQLYDLPPGAVLVYPRNTENNYDFTQGAHHGHIGIIIGKDSNGDMIVGSDHHTYLSKDLENMEHTPTVWVPIIQEEEVVENAAGGSVASTDLTTSEQLAIGYDYGTVPDYYPESGEYQAALKNEFGVIMNGFTEEEMTWAWELLWSVSDTNFPLLVEGIIYSKEGEDGDYSKQVQCGWNGQPDVEFAPYGNEVQFKNLFIHEAGHYIHCRDWVETEGELLDEMDTIMEAEGAVSEYGEDDSHENFADMLMYALNPADGFVSVGKGSPENPIYNGSRPLHTQFAMRILMGPLEGLPTAPESVANG